MELRVLGAVEVRKDGVPARLGGPKQRTVLALLAAEVGRAVSADRLIDSLWGGEAPAGSRHTLQTYISNLRSELGDVVVREGSGYRLDLDRNGVDAARFEDEVAAARTMLVDHPLDAAARLREALSLWRGHPFADQVGVVILEVEAARLEELRLRAVEDRIEAELALGLHSDLVGDLEALTAEFPLREGFRVQQMLALYRAGRQAEALRAYQKTRSYLGEELGIEPSPQLRELEQRILEQDPSLDVSVEPQVQSLAFLVSEVEDSAVVGELRGPQMRSALSLQDRIITEAVEEAGGQVFNRADGGISAVFPDVTRAVAAAQAAQASLASADWGKVPQFGVRMAIDVGEVESRAGDFFGPPLNRCTRLMASGHGGQVLLSADAHSALSAGSKSGWQAKALGDYRFKGLGRVQQVFQLVVDGLPSEFPSLVVDRMPHPLAGDGAGRTLRGYELREQVGGGDFGVVYRAYQPSVGREVALKTIRPELASEPAFVRLFEAEAQLVAALEHPHIVSLYDFWRDPDGAYLVMRWMRGGSLRQALDRGPWNAEPALRLLNQVGGALAYAHRQGVVHRDLKPSNVLLDEEGNGYLSDFGIAHRLVDASASARPQTSSPAYLAPEELRGEPLRLTSDIYALGLMTFELVSGRSPPMDGSLPSISGLRPEIPGEVDEVVARATREDSESRFPSVESFLTALSQALGEPVEVEQIGLTPTRNPYKGLHAFGERDAQDFFGRDSVVAEVVETVADHALVAVVGPSGIGKSSVVRAGVIPALRAGALPGSREWLVTDMFPGSYPFEELESALLRVAVERPPSLAEELRRDPLGLVRMSKQLLPPYTPLLLLIDQFEELFTLTLDEETRALFLEALATLVSDQRSRVRVVLTLRADFFDRPLRYPRFGELLRDGMVAVTAPGEDDLAQAVKRPAEGMGMRFEPGLVSRIVAEVEEQPGALPLLQYALTELFGSRTSDLMTVPGYRATGGVLGALATRAEELYGQLDRVGREAARQVFLRLVTVQETAEDTRRRVQKRELRALGVDPQMLDQVLERFGEYRLLTFDRDPLTRGPTVEVAHEALLTEWGRLRDWITERREDLLLHRRLAEAVAEWEASSKSAEFLLQRGRLDQFESWAAGTDLLLTASEREFLATGRVEEDRRRRRLTRRRWVIVGVLIAALVIIAGVALNSRNRAQLATARELAAASASVVDTDPQLAILLALEGIKATPQPQREAIEALHESLQANSVLAAVGWPADRPAATMMGVAPSPDGSRVAVSADGATVDIWDTENKTLVRTIGGTEVTEIPLAWPMIDWHGDRLAGLGPDGVLRVWDSESGEEVRRVEADSVGPGTTAFSPDGSLVATAHQVGSPVESPTVLRMWDTGSLEMEWERPYDSLIQVSFAPDGQWIAVAQFATGGESGLVEVLDVATGRPRFAFDVDTWVPGIAYTSDGMLVRAGWDGLITIHDGTTGERTRDFGPVTWPIVAASPVGSLVALGNEIWDVESGELVQRLLGGSAEVGRIRFTTDASRVFTGGSDLIARMWPVGPGPGELFSMSPAPVVHSIDLSPDGSRLAILALEESYPSIGEVQIWSIAPLERLATIPGGHGYGITFSPDGELVAAFTREVISTLDTSDDLLGIDRLALWDTDSGALVTELPGGGELTGLEGGSRAAFSPDGSLVAGVGSAGLAGVWEVETGRSLGDPWRVSQSQANGVVFTTDGSNLVIVDNDNYLRVWRIADRNLVQEFDHGGLIDDVAVSPDGRTVISFGLEVTSIWDLETGDRTDLPSQGIGGDLSRDGALLALPAAGEIGVWDLTAPQLALRGHEGTVRFHPDGIHLVTGGGNSVRGWTLDVEELIEIAGRRLTRAMTDAECQTYLHLDTCPTE